MKKVKRNKLTLIGILVMALALITFPGALGAVDEIQEQLCLTRLDVSETSVDAMFELSTPCGQPIMEVCIIETSQSWCAISDGVFGLGGMEVLSGMGTDTVNVYVPGSSDFVDIWYDCAECPKRSASEPEPERTMPLTCYQVWINDDNCFEFVFWWEYADNNWVKIYDMAGNEVFSIDMTYGKANFEACLPDGMYTVKTFHNGFEKPIQEFIIGKP